MKYGFVSDVHGDLPGLQRALQSLEEAEAIYSLGDVAGGREVEECIQLMRSRGVVAVPGNHDLWDFELEGLPQSSQDYLRALPLEREVEDWLAVHSDYELDQGKAHFPYIHGERAARRAFEHFPQRLIFFGHTHLSQFHRLTPEGTILFAKAMTNAPIELDPASRYLINVGMAAQATVLYDSTARRVHYHLFTRPQPPATVSAPTLWQRLQNFFRPSS